MPQHHDFQHIVRSAQEQSDENPFDDFSVEARDGAWTRLLLFLGRQMESITLKCCGSSGRLPAIPVPEAVRATDQPFSRSFVGSCCLSVTAVIQDDFA